MTTGSAISRTSDRTASQRFAVSVPRAPEASGCAVRATSGLGRVGRATAVLDTTCGGDVHCQRLHLTDIRDARLHLDGRTIVLADAVRNRLTTWLDYRNSRWAHTANPHLFIHYRTAGTVDQVGRRWIGLAVGDDLSPAAIRDDRILDEAIATRGDPRRLADLFGLSIKAGTRYTDTIEHPDLNQSTRPDTTP